MSNNNQPEVRRKIAYIGAWNIVMLDRRNPYIVAFWSMAYAGLGHIFLDKYFRGIILFVGETLFNYLAHLNVAIFYSVLGRFDLATRTVDARWLILYMAVYCLAIFDSYREAVEINNTYILAAREDSKINCFAISPGGFTHLNSVPPVYAAIYSAALPGAGCFILQRMNRAIYFIIIWAVNAYLSGLYLAIVFTFAGRFELAKSALNVQWFLNLPSLWFYTIYESYSAAMENNKLYRWELSKYLKKDYQSDSFIMPRFKKEDNKMYLFSTFDHSNKIESAVTALQMKGIPKDSILAVPLDRRNEQQLLFDTVQSSDSKSILALPMIISMIFALLGSIIGFQFKWGPIIWGVIGAAAGFAIGLVIRFIVASARKYKLKSGKEGKEGIVVIVQCETNQLEMAKDILWANAAMGVAKFDPGPGV